jgi:hypothetical protein
MAYNIFLFVKTINIYGLVPIFIEIILLILILTKSRYAKIGIILWASIFLIIGYGFELAADLIDAFNDSFITIKTGLIIQSAVGLAIGILIISYTRSTVVLISSNVE